MPSAPPKRQPRLKESCDRCSVAKVRCDKSKPSCSRCQQKGMACGYSFSRRAGRRTTSSISSLASIIDRSGSSSPMHLSHTSSASPASMSPHLSQSPGSADLDNDVFDLWSYPQQRTTQLPPTTNPQFDWEDGLYPMATPTMFDQSFAFPNSGDPSLAVPLDSVMDSTMPSFTSAPLMPAEPSAPAVLMAQNMHRTSTSTSTIFSNESGSSQADAVQDELANLSDFAEAMEKKFDAVVKQRMQHRDMYSEFGVPIEDMDDGSGGLDRKSSPQATDPDLSELSMYYSLAELKRRLKWLREDVGNLVVHP